MPGCVGFLLCILIRTILITIEDGMPVDLYDKYPGLILVVPSVMILALLSIVCSVKLFQDMITVNKESWHSRCRARRIPAAVLVACSTKERLSDAISLLYSC